MSKGNKLRPLTDWYVRTIAGENILVGWEIYARRPVVKRIDYRMVGEYRGHRHPLYVCEGRRYICSGPAANKDVWRVYHAIADRGSV